MKGTIIMLHGWAQNAIVMKSRTAKLQKKLNQAGYECVYLEAPHLLPMTSTVEIDGQLVQISNGERENAKAWFTYSETDSADASLSLTQTPMKYIGLQDSISIVREYLIKRIDEKPCAILGFSQGATFCHILSMLVASAAKMGNDSDSDIFCPFNKIKCAIMLSGFPSMHNGTLLTSNINVAEQNTKLDIKSLHIFGEKDTSVPKSFGDKLAECFVDPETYDHGKGHVIPHKAAFCERVIQFVDSYLAN